MVARNGKHSYQYIVSDKYTVYTVTPYNRYKYNGCDRVVEGAGYMIKRLVLYIQCIKCVLLWVLIPSREYTKIVSSNFLF